MKKSKYLMMLMVLMLVVALVSIVACGKKDEAPSQTGDTGTTAPTKTLKIGFIMPMSGPASLWGIAIQKDVNAYTAVINEEGGLKIGDEYYTVENYFADDEATPDKAAQTTNELINNDGVSAILGYWGIGLPTIASITTPAKVITNFTKPINYNKDTMPYAAFSHDDSYLGFAQLAAIISAFPEMKTMGISADEVYYAGGKNTIPAFKEILTEKGIKFVEDVYPWSTIDYTTHIEKLHQLGADTLFSWSAPEFEAGKQKEIYNRGYKMNFAGAGTIVDLKSYMDISGKEAAQGGLHPYNYPWALKTYNIQPEIVDVALKIKAKTEQMQGKAEIDYDGAFPYGLNSMLMYFQALQKAGTTDPDKVMEVTRGGTFDLFSGTQTLGGLETYGSAVMGHPIGPMGKVEGDKMVFSSEGPAYDVP
ncbi:MAG: ABC transporter substrate-binding protein [Bacillota bacterium]